MRMEPNEPAVPAALPAKRTRKVVNYRDMEDDLDDLDFDLPKSEKKSSSSSSKKKGGNPVRRRAPNPVLTQEDADLLDGLDEDIDAMNPDQLRAEIEKVKAQITRIEEELQQEPVVRHESLCIASKCFFLISL